LLKEKYEVSQDVARKVGKMLENCSIQKLLELADLVDDKNNYNEWEFYWNSVLNPKTP